MTVAYNTFATRIKQITSQNTNDQQKYLDLQVAAGLALISVVSAFSAPFWADAGGEGAALKLLLSGITALSGLAAFGNGILDKLMGI